LIIKIYLEYIQNIFNFLVHSIFNFFYFIYFIKHTKSEFLEEWSNERIQTHKYTLSISCKKSTYWKHKYTQELRVLRFREKNQARKVWNSRTTKICLLMTQQCYSKHRNFNHSKLQIKNKTTWETRARKTTGSKGKWRIELWQKNQTPNKGGTPQTKHWTTS
jgi:hypothetical protein